MKYWILALILALTAYAPIELTRVIVLSGWFYFPEMQGQFIGELITMWTLYLLIIPVFLKLNNKD